MNNGLMNTMKLRRLALLPMCLLVACASGPQVKYTDENKEEFVVKSNLDLDYETDREVLNRNKDQQPTDNNLQTPEERPAVIAEEKPVLPPKLSLQQRMPKADTGAQIPSWISQRKYSFKANRIDIREALKMFARLYQLNIYHEPEVAGTISVEFDNLPLNRAMEVILGSHKFYWQWQENLIYVGKYQTKNYVIDYIRLTRSGAGSSDVSISSSGDEQNRGGTSSTITQGDKISFWEELEAQLKTLISATGQLTINKTTGTVQITDTPDHIKQVDRFVSDIKRALLRQVIIEARIVEVQLNDDNRLGVDWSEMNFLDFAGSTSTLTGLMNGGLPLKAATVKLDYNDSRFKGMVSALAEQGDVKVMSQPRIRTLNNQPAVFKVGTDRTFFTTIATATTGSGATQVVTSEKATTVTEGVVLSVTPQISADGKIILDVSPVITRIADVTVSQHGSTAPVLDIKQTSTLVQAASGEMIVVGGLIQDINVKRSRRVPILGDIPFFGHLFRSDSSGTQRTELVIFLVPKIIG